MWQMQHIKDLQAFIGHIVDNIVEHIVPWYVWSDFIIKQLEINQF